MKLKILASILMIVLWAPSISYSQESEKDQVYDNLNITNDDFIIYRNELATITNTVMDLRSSISKEDMSSFMLIRYELLLMVSYMDIFQCRCNTAMWQLKSQEDINTKDILEIYNSNLDIYKKKISEGMNNINLFSRFIRNKNVLIQINSYKELMDKIKIKIDIYIERNKKISLK